MDLRGARKRGRLLTVVEPLWRSTTKKLGRPETASRPPLADFFAAPNSVADGPETVCRIAILGSGMCLPPNLLSAFVTMFVTIGPIETAVVFAALTAGVHRPERKSLAARSVTIAGVVLLLFAMGGGAVLSLLHVSLPAFRVAGGVLLFLQALTLTFSNPGLSSINASETRDAQQGGDIAIFPLAFPLIAGPGSLAAVVLVMGRAEAWLERGAVVLMVAICLAVTYFAMLVSEPLVRRLGQTGSDVVGRISGVLLAGLAVQFIFDGVRQAALFAPT